MSDNLPTTTSHFRLPKHPNGVTTRPINKLFHKQGKFVVGWGPGAIEEPVGLEYEIYGSDFGWLRFGKGGDQRFIPDDPSKPTLERDELGDLDQALWRIGSDDKPLDPWSRAARLKLVRVRDGTPLIFETTTKTACEEVEGLVTRICWLANKHPGARPVIVTDTKLTPNGKGQNFWIPVFTIVRWDEPDGTVMPPEPEPQQMPSIEGPAPAVKPPPEVMDAVGGIHTGAPRGRKPRNAYASQNAKPTAKPHAALEDDFDDEVP